jgi:hypothetical protein
MTARALALQSTSGTLASTPDRKTHPVQGRVFWSLETSKSTEEKGAMVMNFKRWSYKAATTLFAAIFAASAWAGNTYKVLHAFGQGFDGWAPESGLVLDSHGNLFGTTTAGGSPANSRRAAHTIESQVSALTERARSDGTPCRRSDSLLMMGSQGHTGSPSSGSAARSSGRRRN